MGYNIGPRIGIEGESEFRESIRKINAEYKTMTAETKALTSAFDANGDQQGKLKVKSEQLVKLVAKQKEKVDLLSAAVEKASAKYGKESMEVTRLQGVLYDAQAAVGKMETELRETGEALDAFEDGLDNVGDASEDAEEKVVSFSDILSAGIISNVATSLIGKAADGVKEFAQGSIEAAADANAAASQFEQTFGELQGNAERLLSEISADVNVTTTRMQGDFTKLYAFMKTAGTDAEDALDLSGRAMRAAADNAAYYDKSIEEATEQLQSFLKGNYENDAALGIAATETTRNAKANELYAKSFKDLAESQKIEVLLAMVEAGNEASGALGQAAREADSWANVTGELSEAVRMLQAEVGQPILKMATFVVRDFTDSLKNLLEESDYEVALEDLGTGVEKLSAALDGSQEKFEKTRENTEGNAAAARVYAEMLADIESAGLGTASTQRQYAAVVKELQGLMPGLNLEIDEQTGLLKQNTDQIYSQIDALAAQAVNEARQQKYTEDLKAYGTATVAVEDAELALQKTRKDGEGIAARKAEIEKQLTVAQAELAKYEQTNASSTAAAADAYGSRAESVAKLKQEVDMLAGEYMAVTNAERENTAQQAELNAKITESKQVLSEYQEKLGLSAQQTDDAAKKNEILRATQQQLQQELDAINQTYDEAVVAARESVDSQIGCFDELKLSGEVTAQSIMDNWSSQQAAFDNYSANLQAAIDMGLDETLVKQLADGSKESMEVLNAFVTDTDTDVGKINAAFAKTQESRSTMAKTMAGIKTDYENEMDEIVRRASEDGMYIVDGVVQGVANYAWRFENEMASLGRRGLGAFNQVMQTHSPSKAMEESGMWIDYGAALGVDKHTKRFEESMINLARKGQEQYRIQAIDPQVYVPTISVPQSVQQVATTRNNYGGVAINVYQQPGESGQDLADQIADALEFRTLQRGAALC